jgi:hypothetical protein
MHSLRTIRLTLVTIALVTTACSASAASPGSPAPSAPAPSGSATASAPSSATPSPTASVEASCDPACQLMQIQPPAITAPGSLPVGRYTTVNFYPGGLSVTLDQGWSSKEDSTGEFNLTDDRGGINDELLFWLDVTPVTFDGKPISGIDNTPSGVSDWLHGLTWLTVSPAKKTTIGKAHLPALVMDLTIPKTAPNGDPECPVAACINVLKFPEWDLAWAMGIDMKTRVYLAQIGDGPHMLFLMFNVYDADFFAPRVQPVIDSISLSDALD